jgi:putative RecB family exonuclease
MVHGSLSPSRASDFMTCPLRYRYRVVDRLPEAPSEAAVRGTLVHAVLEQLFDLPAAERTVQRAAELLEPSWRQLCAEEQDLVGLFPADAAPKFEAWLQSARDLLAAYFTLEDPTRLQPAARELMLEHDLFEGLRLRGIVDRLDAARTGELRVVDYKTGRSPGPAFEKSALFQMKFYALLLWHTRGIVPRELRLYYLGDRVSLVYSPDEDELRSFERTIRALWAAIARAHETGDWRPRRSRLCDWCDHQARCPEFGGEILPLPTARESALESSVSVCEAEG